MKNCLTKHHAQLRNFDTSEVTSAADAYRSRGKEDQAANVAAIEDHLRDLRQQRVKMEAAIVAAWKERDPEGYANAAPDANARLVAAADRVAAGETPSAADLAEFPTLADLAKSKQAFALKGETEAEIKDREAQEKAAADEKAKIENAPSEKDFTLTGSDRPVDVAEAHGQKPMFARGGAFYSELERQLEGVNTTTAPAAQWIATLKNLKGVKADELEWSGVLDWLATRDGKVTKAEVQAFLEQNGVRIEETLLGANETGGAKQATSEMDRVRVELDALGFDLETDDFQNLALELHHRSTGARFGAHDHGEMLDPDMGLRGFDDLPENVQALVDRWDAAASYGRDDISNHQPGSTKFSQYTLPGGENYRELLLTLPEKREDALTPVEQDRYLELRSVLPGALENWERAELASLVRRAEGVDASRRQNFRSSHFDQPNILAHVRFDERTDADGKKVLFIEEIQSDWAQKGKRTGFVAPLTAERRAEITRRLNEIQRTEKPAAERDSGAYHALDAEEGSLQYELNGIGTPRAPFVGKTEAWVALAVKRMVRYAAEHGFDRVAWTNGEQQADRYDLSKHIKTLRSERIAHEGAPGLGQYVLTATTHDGRTVNLGSHTKESLPDAIGKAMAEKITANGDRVQIYRDLDLKVGGEGMKSFYDKIIPNVVNDVLKKVGGGRVREIEFAPSAKQTPSWTRAETDARTGEIGVQPGFDITPAMREKVMGGLPLFRRAPESKGRHATEVRGWLKDVIARSKLPIRVVQTVDDLRKQDGFENAPDDAKGGYLDGRIWVVADNISDAVDAEATVARHEITHGGIDILYGNTDARERALTAIELKNPQVSRGAEQWRAQYGREVVDEAMQRGMSEEEATRQMNLESIEESLAYFAQDGNEIKGWQAFIAVIQKGLRAMGLNRLADSLEKATNAEVMQFLDMVRRATEDHAAEVSRREPAFHRADPSYALHGFTTAPEAPAWVAKQSKEMQEALRKAGAWRPQQSLKDRMAEWTTDWQKKVRQGMVDQFDPIKSLDYQAYMLARMSKSSAGPLESMLFDGTVFLDKDGAVDVNYEKGGFVGLMQKLHGEHDRFFSWVIANRAERLLAEGKEHNLTADDVKRLKTLADGKMRDGKSRAVVYGQANADLQRYNKAAVDMAEKAGLIDRDSRPLWEKDFYIPFYRVMEDEVKGPTPKKGLVRQYAFKALKGGAEAIGDPMENILKNWAHLIDASLKNNAARAAILAAEKMGVALEAPEEAARQMAKAAGMKDAVVYFTDQGVKRHFVIDDPFVFDAVNSLAFTGFSGTGMKIMGTFKHWLTYGTTISPTFRIRNVIRDSLTMIGTNPAPYNVLSNALTGWKATEEGSAVYASMIAGGGVIRFGSMQEDSGRNVKRLIDAGVDEATILDSPAKLKGMLTSAYDWWMHVGDRSENINRAALYQHLRDQGKSHLEASYAARDTMDFSMQGTWAAVRFLAQTVPFFNARLQGLYKLGRGAAEDPRRFAYVAGAASLASIALLLAYKDDDDWKQREDWDRETYWWFKVGDKAFRIPKPFEIGALGTLAERGVEALVTDDLTGKQFAQRMGAVVMQQLSMNPVPQLFMPIIETWANQNTFTGRPIESTGMEKLSPSQRSGPETSAFAQVAGKNGVVSPVQIDHLVSGYFGWLGMHAIATADLALRPAMGAPGKPAPRINEVFVAGDFVKNAPDYQSKYLTQLYKQGKEVQELMADVRQLQKVGAIDKARELLEENRDKIKLVGLYNHAEHELTAINQRIKMVQTRDGDPETKRQQLDALYAMKNRLAKIIDQRTRELTP